MEDASRPQIDRSETLPGEGRVLPADDLGSGHINVRAVNECLWRPDYPGKILTTQNAESRLDCYLSLVEGNESTVASISPARIES
jgi:hypothetical protein